MKDDEGVLAVLGANVKRAREARGWSQERLASLLSEVLERDIKPLTVLRLEKGTRPTTVAELVALANVFALGIGTLIGQDDNSDATVYPVLTRAAAARMAYLDAVAGLRKAERDLEAVDLNGASDQARQDHRDRLAQVRGLLEGDAPGRHYRMEEFFGDSDGSAS